MFVVAVLALVEIGVRAVETRLSVDVIHIKSINGVVRDLIRSSEMADERSVLFIGNSLTRRGVDIDVFTETLERGGLSRLRLAAVYPDDTTVLDWTYLYKHAVREAGAVPDAVVIGFGWTHLDDRPVSRAQSYRLGRYFASWADMPPLLREDVTALPDRVNIVLSKVSATFANRERISKRVLSFLPYYQASANTVNEIALRDNKAEGDDRSDSRYRRLEQLIEAVEESGAELVFISMPMLEGHDLDPRIVEIIEANGSHHVDARDVPGLAPEHYLDPLHLDPASGALLYSSHAAELLVPVLAQLLPDAKGGD